MNDVKIAAPPTADMLLLATVFGLLCVIAWIGLRVLLLEARTLRLRSGRRSMLGTLGIGALLSLPASLLAQHLAAIVAALLGGGTPSWLLGALTAACTVVGAVVLTSRRLEGHLEHRTSILAALCMSATAAAISLSTLVNQPVLGLSVPLWWPVVWISIFAVLRILNRDGRYDQLVVAKG